jgi:hypothetical protein
VIEAAVMVAAALYCHTVAVFSILFELSFVLWLYNRSALDVEDSS